MRKLLALLTATLLLTGQLFAQKTITGKVNDANGTALRGASVTAKGTRTGTQTDANGKKQGYWKKKDEKTNIESYRRSIVGDLDVDDIRAGLGVRTGQ